MIFHGRIKVLEVGKDYSDYAQNLANVMNGMLFFAGFTFTVVAILLTSLPNPRSMQSQFTLLFLTAIFYLTVFLAIFLLIDITRHIEKVPPLNRQRRIVNALVFLTFLLIGLAFPLLFLLWDLIMLAIISSVVWLLFAISILFFIYMPFQRRRAEKGKPDKI
jgi:O-antigen/teichoic acid export membrane protein